MGAPIYHNKYHKVRIRGEYKTVDVKITSNKDLLVNGRDTGYDYNPQTGYYYRAGSRVTNDLDILLSMIL